jgi:alkylation response protein AidB-like acyl-CoA dehydrogenase
MTVNQMITLAEELERYLGDPHDPKSRMPFERVLTSDEREEFPFELVGVLQRWGLHEYCLPEEYGGRAGDVEVGFNLLRLAARRDPTTATALMLTDLAFMPAWIAGTDEQRFELLEGIKNGTRMAWGLSERHHGSDVLGNEMRAVKVDGGYRLTGEKWLIGNATLADIISVHARTDERGGPGGWSIFAVNKKRCPAGSIVELPNEKLHGLRALDMSGIRLDGLFVPDEARLGAEGQGLEIALKSAQVARTTVTSMSLGAVDTAFRVTMDFVTQREIFGRRVVEMPYTRRQLAECFADLMLADAMATGAVRGLQANPGQASVFSSIVKFFIPTLLERSMAQLSIVLGARIYLRGHPHYGIYQKMLRDVLVAIFADGNTVVNLKNIALQLDGFLGNALAQDSALREQAAPRVRAMFHVDTKLPGWIPAQQQLFSRGLDDVVIAFPESIEALRAMASRAAGRQAEWLHRAADVADAIAGQLTGLAGSVAQLKTALGKELGSSAELFRLAEQYCAINAAACAVHLAVHSAGLFGETFPDGAVLLMTMERVWRLFYPTEPVTDAAAVDRVMEHVSRLHREHRLFSPWELQLQASEGSHA